ncbi:alpha/beta hydrolase [Streptacidiphilus pinicola]|uniref:Alpha/beta hydrolase n=1 Tax=Streptacidiphilus pinicola TaxID=2219663 RepID=A0A2X0I9D0_9ACTN|nr:alpha/beta hydrolase [Streptacidiphilus pinicola]RAG81097.1 alpha/beta hydrolase [Streptacidiphilus pinicola]
MHDAQVTPAGDRIRWIELPGSGEGRPRVYLHGLGASSGPYFAATAVHPALAGPRSLLVDLLGFGISDRPEDFPYTLEAHADTLAAALRAAEVTDADVIAHSMGGSVAIVLATRHPSLVARLVLVDANLDALPAVRGRVGSSGIASYGEEEFVSGGWREVRDHVGAHWWSTMRLAGLTALHRSAVSLAAGSDPVMREQLLGLDLPRTFVHPEADGAPDGAAELAAAGVRLVAIPDCDHNIMLDNPEAFARATAAALADG